MNKKLIIGLIVAVIVIVAACVGFAIYRGINTEENSNTTENIENKKAENENKNTTANTSRNNTNVENKTNDEDDDEKPSGNGKILVAYYSAQSHTKAVAEKVAENLDADIFEIVPEEPYTSADLNWNDEESRVSKEHEDESLRDVKLVNTKVDNWEEYDTVIIGYPIWWGTAAWPVDNFVKENNFEGKTVIPFCTSASSGLGRSGELLEEEAGTGNWEEGHRFSSNPSDSDIKNWTDSLK